MAEAHWNSTIDLVKIQRPIMTNDESRPWLFYNKSRALEFEAPEDGVGLNFIKAMDGDLIMFANVYVDFNEGRVDLLKRVHFADGEYPTW